MVQRFSCKWRKTGNESSCSKFCSVPPDGSGWGPKTTSIGLERVNDDVFFNSIVAGDETWVYGYEIETKAQSRHNKARSHVKVTLTVFCAWCCTMTLVIRDICIKMINPLTRLIWPLPTFFISLAQVPPRETKIWHHHVIISAKHQDLQVLGLKNTKTT